MSLQRAFCVWWGGHPREAVAFATTALARGEETGDFPLSVSAQIYLAFSLQTCGDYVGGAATLARLVATLEGERLCEFAGRHAYVIARTHLAYSLSQRGVFPEALAVVEEAIRFSEATDNRAGLLAALWCRGDVLTTRRRLPEAIADHERALSLCHEYEVSHLRPGIIGGLGYAQVLAGRLAEGTASLRRAIALMEQGRWRYAYTMQHERLGEALRLAGCLDEAEAVAERALTLARERGERAAEACVLRLTSEVAAARGAMDAAGTTLRAALALARELGMRPLAAQCHRDLGALLHAAGKVDDARDETETARRLFEAMEIGWVEAPAATSGGARQGDARPRRSRAPRRVR